MIAWLAGSLILVVLCIASVLLQLGFAALLIVSAIVLAGVISLIGIVTAWATGRRAA